MRGIMKTEPLTASEIDQVVALVKTLGEDCLVTTPRELGKQLGLNADQLIEHFKQYFIGHNPRRLLRGEEGIGAAVVILFIPPDWSGPGHLAIMSAKREYKNEYLKFKSEPAKRIH